MEFLNSEGHPSEEMSCRGKQQRAAHSPRPHHSLPGVAHLESVSVLHGATLQSQDDRLR